MKWAVGFLLVLAACAQPVEIPEDATADERLDIVNDNLHARNSGVYVYESFDDLEQLFAWQPETGSKKIYPFRYYYSEEVDMTFTICNVNRTVAICEGKMHEHINDENRAGCTVTPEYETYI